MPEDSNAFANVISAVAVHFSAWAVGVSFTFNLFEFTGEVIELGLYIGETIDTADNHCSVFSQTVKNNTERFLTYFISHLSDFNSAFSGSERLMSCQESEALGLFAEQTCSEVTVTDTYFTIVGYRTRNAECLQSDTDSFGCVSRVLATFLEGDSGAYYVSPFSVLEADALGLFASHIRVEAILFAYLVCFFDRLNAISIEGSENLFLAAVLRLKLYWTYHSFTPFLGL